jgi:RNA recognition motif-containing protein
LRDAWKRLLNALKQVPTAVHKSRKARSTATLYVGNIEFNATEDDLRESLEECLGYRIVVEKITIPRMNGKSMYGVIKFSWAQATPVEVFI